MYYVVIQKENEMAFAEKLVEFEIILGKISQTQKDFVFSHMQNLYLKEKFL